MLRVAKIIPRTTAEGPFERCAIWVAGCDLRCPGCCNPDLFDPSAGQPMKVAEILEFAADVEGITVLGGEPLQQRPGLQALLEAARAWGLGTIVFTGHTLAQARALPGFSEIWTRLDTLVDGPFDAHRPERARRFIGSANQGLHHRTPRYADPAQWSGPTRVEIRVGPRGEVELHGLPKAVARVARTLG